MEFNEDGTVRIRTAAQAMEMAETSQRRHRVKYYEDKVEEFIKKGMTIGEAHDAADELMLERMMANGF